jgi:hypothetical protein
MIIDHANLRNFFINKNLNRRKIRWWERLAKLNLKIEYWFDKNNFVDDSSRRQNYEKQIAHEDKLRNENLNLKKWTLIESSAKKTNDTFFQNFLKESFSSKIMTIRSRDISNTNARWIFWKESISDSTWAKTLRNTSTRARLVIESRSWDTDRMKCCNLFRFQKIQDKIERWILSSTCRLRSTEISCTIRF